MIESYGYTHENGYFTPDVRVIADLTGLTGAHTIEIFYRSANYTLVLMDTINIVIG